MRDVIEVVSKCIEASAVFIIVAGILNAAARYLIASRRTGSAYRRFKDRIGGSLMLGLEFLVAADVVDTVAARPTLQGIAGLGLLVLIRTFLSWSLVVEMEGHWPWKRQTEQGAEGSV